MSISKSNTASNFRTKRTAVNITCSNATDCVPYDLRGHVPQDFIDCDNSSCICSGCFELFAGICQISKCQGFNNVSQTCTDNRKSQETAILLSAFLSSVGAANFYIGQYTLGESPFFGAKI